MKNTNRYIALALCFTLIAAGEYNLKSAVSSAQMQTVYMIYKTVVSGMLVVAFLHLCYKKLKEVQRN